MTKAQRRAQRRALRADRSNNIDSDTNKPHPNPDNNGGDQNKYKWDGNTRVSGEIVVKAPEDLLTDYKTGQNKNEANNRKLRLISWLTLVAVVIYAGLTGWQGYLTRQTLGEAKEANRLLEESTRANLSFEWKLEPVTIGLPVKATIQITNVGHSLALVTTQYGNDVGVEMPNVEMPLSAGNQVTILEPGKQMFTLATDPRPVTQQFADQLPRLSDLDVATKRKPKTATVYLYGRIDYQTLGKQHEIEFCSFLIRNDHTVVQFPDSTFGEQDFVLLNCPKWNFAR